VDPFDPHHYEHDQYQDLHHYEHNQHQDPHWYDQHQDPHHPVPGHQDPHWLDTMRDHIPRGGQNEHILQDLHHISDFFSQHFQQYEHFNPLHDMHHVIGNPKEDMQYWHEQNDAHSCALASADFVVSGLTGAHVPEQLLEHMAVENGWHLPGLGTPLDQIGKLVESFGFEVHQTDHSSLMNLEKELSDKHKVIVGVNAEEIWLHNTHSMPLEAFPGIPGQKADHAVEVIGIDLSDAAHPMVILNDPALPDGRGAEIPLDVFSQAWAASDNFMVSTTGHACVPPSQGFLTPLSQEGTSEGYSDETYQW